MGLLLEARTCGKCGGGMRFSREPSGKVFICRKREEFYKGTFFEKVRTRVKEVFRLPYY